MEVDKETGRVAIVRYVAVTDAGQVINPLLLEGQIHGWIGQGAGQVLMEGIQYDAKSGQMLTGSFLDYAMPRASDFCSFELTDHPTLTDTNPIGSKGAGEVGAATNCMDFRYSVASGEHDGDVRVVEVPASVPCPQ